MISRFVLCVFGLCVAATAGADAGQRLHTFDAVTVSPDGRAVVAVESDEPPPTASSAAPGWIVIRSLSGGRPVRLTCHRGVGCTQSSPVWSPDGSRIAYIERDGTTRRSSVWTIAADGSRPVALARAFSGVIAAPRWSPDGTSLAVLATADAHKEIGATQAGAALTGEISATLAQDVQRIAYLRDGGVHFASPRDLFIYEYDWLPGGRGFVATAAHGNGDNNWWIAKLYRIDERARARVLYAPRVQIDAPRVSPDGTRVAFIGGLMSDFGSVGGDVYVVGTSGGAAVDLTPDMRATADGIAWNGSNRRITFTGLAGEKSLLASVDVTAKTVLPRWSGSQRLAAGGPLDVSFARDGRTSAAVRETFEQPPEIVGGTVGRWHALTSANAGFAPAVRARSVSWMNDGFHVQGWLLSPRTLRPGRTYPMIVQIHGGPSAAARPRYVNRGGLKDFIDRGYFVFLPNPRGSFGGGERFAAANVRDFGYGDLRDVLTGIDAVERSAPVDDRRLGLTGWSYGGFMTMFGVTQTHRFRAAFAGAGIADWQSYYGENGIDQWMTPFFGASVYDDPAIYAKSSPITFIKNVRTPTFVVVGERDVECPAPQSMEFWHALADEHVPTSLVIYAGEGHGIRRPADRADITRRSLAWFKRYLGS